MSTLRRLSGMGAFCVRHGVASAITVVSACTLWTAVYITLFLWVIFTGAPIGSPLAYPAGLLFFGLATTAASLLFFFPATALAEYLCNRFRIPILAQIPVSVALFAVLSLFAVGTPLSQSSNVAFGDILLNWSIIFAALLIPLGLYWWSAQSLPLLVALLRRLRNASIWPGGPARS